MTNKFDSKLVIPWFKWIFKQPRSTAGVIYFLSKRYNTSPRFFPLYNSCKDTEIILFRGSRFPGVDRLYLKLIPMFVALFKRKLSSYSVFIALNDSAKLVLSTNMILNLDDPTYEVSELKAIIEWEQKVKSNGYTSTIVCTTDHMWNYLIRNGIQSRIKVIPQGHSYSSFIKPASLREPVKEKCRFVYISPSIDVKGDLHEGHNMWDASILLNEIWPRIKATNVELHLIGRMGRNAKKSLVDSRIISYGFVSIEKCSNMLGEFDVGLYPRMKANSWLPQKLIEYVGAGLPTIAFDTSDTQIVRDLGIGILAKDTQDFIRAMENISRNPDQLQFMKQQCVKNSGQFSWQYLAKEFESLYQ